MFLGNQRTRPVGYAQKKYAGPPSRKTFASSTMIVSGLWLLAFLIVHVKAFRFGVEQEWPAGGRDLYLLEMEAFTNPLMVGFYVISMVVVGSHLWHGVSSAFQSLGLDKPAWTRFILPAGKMIAVLIAGGFIVIALWAHFDRSPVMKLDARVPAGPIAREVGPAQVRDEAGQPGQQAQVHDHRRRHRAWPARRRPPRSASSATTS